MWGAEWLLRVDTIPVEQLTHRRFFVATATGLLLALAVFAYGFANSGQISAQADPADTAGLVIYDDTAGPYSVKITQSPERAIVGTVRLIVEPVDRETGLPVESALVRIFGTPEEEGERQFSPGLNAPSDPSVYFGQLELEEPGVWTIDVEIDADQGRAIAITQATIHERARSGSSTLIGTILFVLVSGAFVGAGLWLWYSSKKARQRRDAIRQAGGRPRRSSG